jgi:hypothetical protein
MLKSSSFEHLTSEELEIIKSWLRDHAPEAWQFVVLNTCRTTDGTRFTLSIPNEPLGLRIQKHLESRRNVQL